MCISLIQKGDEVPERRIGPGIVGYAYLRVGNTRRVGLCVRHRPDNSPRLVFDLIVYYDRAASVDLPYFRRVRTEVTLEELPRRIDVLIGQRHWKNSRGMIPPLASEPWRSLPEPESPIQGEDNSTVWQGNRVSFLSWRNGLRWSVLPGGTKFPPQMGISHCRMAIWDSDDSVCIVNTEWLNSSRHSCSLPPKLFRDDEYTYFFPEVPQSAVQE